MKPVLMGLLLIVCGVFASAGPASDSLVIRLQAILDQKDFFRLKATLEREGAALTVSNRVYFQAFVDNVFGRNDLSLREVSALLGEAKNGITSKQQCVLWLLQADNYYKMGQYRLATGCCDTLLSRYGDTMDAAQREELGNDRVLWHALEDVPPQEVRMQGPTSIHWIRDAVGLMNVPVRMDSSTYNFVFDTGAGLSTISESFADRLKLRRRVGSLDVQSSTGIHNASTLAVADSLYLGSILLRNVVFLVLPDTQLSFPPIHYSINAILGLPVIWQLQEVHIRRDGTLTLQPGTPTGPPNLALDGWAPIVSVLMDGDSLCFHFDTGASETELYSSYLERYRQKVLLEGKPRTTKRGGAGGIVQTEVYRLKDVRLAVGGRLATLSHLDVLAHPTEGAPDKYFGNLGQDVLSQFPEMVLNFTYMNLNFP
jgi:predicted aspartyl protease